jgi:KaiC/GvpD/RAD55 family RecA-like ATPase
MPHATEARLAFGLPWLDAHLGGGLRPGTLTVIAGATGAGKTQLGLRWAAEGARAETRRGVFFDLTSRGDPQHQEEYARRQFGWRLEEDPQPASRAELLFADTMAPGELYRPFAHLGRRATRPDVDPDAWHAWKTDLARVLRAGAAFAYGQLARGVRRLVFDGVEPAERASDSIQFDYFEYLYEKVIRQDFDWAAREVLREKYRAHEAEVLSRPYQHGSVGCLVLATAPQVLLDDLLAETIGRGDLFATANTIIVMGRTRTEGALGRALCVLKHRGSVCDDRVVPYAIRDDGLVAVGP